MKIVYVYADNPEEWNCSEWRCAIPSRAINRRYPGSSQLLDIASFTQNTPLAQQICDAADVIVVQRNLFGPVLAAMQHWKAREKVVVVDFDDAYNLIPPQVKNFSFWQEGILPPAADGSVWDPIQPSPLIQFKWGLKLAHGVTVPSTRLAQDWQSIQHIDLVPNYIEADKYLKTAPQPHEGVILGWGGSFSHLQSFTDSGLAIALRRVCQARKQVQVLICGDRRVFDAINLPADQKMYQPWVSAEEWPQSLARFDIGMAPLAGEYDQRRSWIKVLEYMLMKIPWAASDGAAYAELSDFGHLVENTPAAWENTLLEMIDHLDDCRRTANETAYKFAIQQNVDENVDQILAVYSAIAERNGIEFSG